MDKIENGHIILDDGKYDFYLYNQILWCQRNGVNWRDFIGDKAVSALFDFALEQEKKLSNIVDYIEDLLTTSFRTEQEKKIALHVLKLISKNI